MHSLTHFRSFRIKERGARDTRNLIMTYHVGTWHRHRNRGGTGGMCPPSFHRLLYKLLTTLCVGSIVPPQSKSLSYAYAWVTHQQSERNRIRDYTELESFQCPFRPLIDGFMGRGFTSGGSGSMLCEKYRLVSATSSAYH